ncbi:MAG: Helix-turn-helix domain, partial [Pseudomonadota bacterium]
MSQTQQILEALARGRTLTPLEALSEFGCLRLAA